MNKVVLHKGDKFNKFTVLEDLGVFSIKEGSRSRHYIKCQCECGTISVVEMSDLKSGNHKSCGMCKSRSMIGKKYNHLTVVCVDHVSDNSDCYYKCKCDCGNETIIRMSHLKTQQTCGKCYRGFPESYKQDVRDRITALSHVYSGIMDRVYNPKSDESIVNYVLRNINVDFDRETFIKMFYLNESYKPGLQIDRINNNKGYTVDNIRWVTPKENNDNRLFSYNITEHDIESRLYTMNTITKLLEKTNKNVNEYIKVRFPFKTTNGHHYYILINKSNNIWRRYHILDTMISVVNSKIDIINRFRKDFKKLKRDDFDLNELI